MSSARRSDEESGRSPYSPDLASQDPAQVFIPGPIISDEDEFGTLISATVGEDFVSRLGVSAVYIRILPVGRRQAAALRDAVERVSKTVSSAAVLKYIGVWEVSPTETWLVSERRRDVCIANLFANIQSHDVESIIAYIAYRALRALQTLHEEHNLPHTNLRPGNIFLSEDGSTCFGDVGIYHVLRESLMSRRSLPGMKLWPLAKTSEKQGSAYNSDIWDLGVTLLVLVEGGASVARLWRSGRRLPRLTNPARWSVQFNSFFSVIFSRASDRQPLLSELLRHRFVAGVSSTACRAATAQYLADGEKRIAGHYVHDTISALFRQNTAVVRAPLISIDDISTEQFTFEQWNGNEQSRPTVEMSVVRILRNCKEQPLPRDTEEGKSLARTVATLEGFLETADMM